MLLNSPKTWGAAVKLYEAWRQQLQSTHWLEMNLWDWIETPVQIHGPTLDLGVKIRRFLLGKKHHSEGWIAALIGDGSELHNDCNTFLHDMQCIA